MNEISKSVEQGSVPTMTGNAWVRSSSLSGSSACSDRSTISDDLGSIALLDRFTCLCLGIPSVEQAQLNHNHRKDRPRKRRVVVCPISVEDRRKSLQHHFFRPVSCDENASFDLRWTGEEANQATERKLDLSMTVRATLSRKVAGAICFMQKMHVDKHKLYCCRRFQVI